MKKHPIAAQSIVAGIEYLRPAMEVVLHHHERWDGTGYPFGLKEKDIPLPARIFSVVDVWDSTQSDRPDRIAWSERKALNHLKDQAGKQFDPQVTSVFLEMIQS